MGKNLDDVLYSHGSVTAIAAGAVVNVQAGLEIDGVAVNPHFVDADLGCVVLGMVNDGLGAATGRFALWNPSADQVADVTWRAEYQHSIEAGIGDPVDEDVEASEVAAPNWPFAQQ